MKGKLLPESFYRARENGRCFSTLKPVPPEQLEDLRKSTPGFPEAFYEFAGEIGLGRTVDDASLFLPEPAVQVPERTSARLYNGDAMKSLRDMFGGRLSPSPHLDLTRIFEFCHTGASWSYCFLPDRDMRVYTLDECGPTLDETSEDFVAFIETSLLR